MRLTIIPFLPFELGESDQARKVVENYKIYGSNGEYSYLQECFANLNYMVKKNLGNKFVVVNACDALARKTHDIYEDVYVKLFIASSAESIYRQARLEPNLYWTEQCRQHGAMIKEKGVDSVQAAKAGLKEFSSIEEAKKNGIKGVIRA